MSSNQKMFFGLILKFFFIFSGKFEFFKILLSDWNFWRFCHSFCAFVYFLVRLGILIIYRQFLTNLFVSFGQFWTFEHFLHWFKFWICLSQFRAFENLFNSFEPKCSNFGSVVSFWAFEHFWSVLSLWKFENLFVSFRFFKISFLLFSSLSVLSLWIFYRQLNHRIKGD